LKRGERGERHQSAHKLLEQDRRVTVRTYLELRLGATNGQLQVCEKKEGKRSERQVLEGGRNPRRTSRLKVARPDS
jgi:hypothetical protein